MIRLPMLALAIILSVGWSPAFASGRQNRPVATRDRYSVRTATFGHWSADIRAMIHNNYISGISCVLQNTDGATITLMKSGENHRLAADFNIDIADRDFDPDNPTKHILEIGKRAYEMKRIPWDFQAIPLRSPVPMETGDVIPIGHTMAAFRASEAEPWLPAEYLIPVLMDEKTIMLSHRFADTILAVDHKMAAGRRKIRMAGFREGMKWCGDAFISKETIKLLRKLK